MMRKMVHRVRALATEQLACVCRPDIEAHERNQRCDSKGAGEMACHTVII